MKAVVSIIFLCVVFAAQAIATHFDMLTLWAIFLGCVLGAIYVTALYMLDD